MAKQKSKYKVPVLDGKISIPKIVPGASSYEHMIEAQKDDMEALGFPSKLQDGWKDKALGVFKEILDHNKAVRDYMDICVRCGACTDKCQFFLGTADPNNMPVQRQELMRKVYRYYFTPSGFFKSLSNAQELTEEVLKEWYTYFWQCSECRRCSLYCPYGIDTAEITMAARQIMDSIGLGQKYTTEVIHKVFKTGNNIGIPPLALRNTLDDLEEEIKEETGKDVKIPMDIEGAEVLLVPPSADFFAMPHMESLKGYAKVFHKSGISYTVSSYASEAGNFGKFIGSYQNTKEINKRIWDEARRLKVKRVIIGECGHAWRAAYMYSNTMNGPFDFLDSNYRQPTHICDFTLGLIKDGVIKLDPSANDDKVVTYHDSCNVARGSRIGDSVGGQFTIPRELIKAAANHFVELREGTTKESTFCCGAGGGLLTEEVMNLRLAGAMPRMQTVKEAVDNHGVNFYALICAICKTQFSKIFPLHGFDEEMVGGIHQLVSNAIIL
ncbi:MAG: sulfate reduction electron transfer complex DsrMKJOP subunit DsrK [bacterium]